MSDNLVKYNEVMQLHSEGLSYNKISKITGIDRWLISGWIRLGFEQGSLVRSKYYKANKIDILKKRKDYRKNNRTKMLDKDRKYYENNKIEILRLNKENYKINKIDILNKKKLRYQLLRQTVLSHYSPTLSCSICGNNDIRVLDLHHEENIGSKHRKEIGDILYWIKKNNFPEGYLVLCANCNWDKEFERRRHSVSPSAKSRHKLKLEVLSHYSHGPPKCHNCGDENLQHLTMDHVSSGGTKHTKEIGGTGANFYRHLRKNDYQKDYQVLCWNCQRIKKSRK